MFDLWVDPEKMSSVRGQLSEEQEGWVDLVDSTPEKVGIFSLFYRNHPGGGRQRVIQVPLPTSGVGLLFGIVRSDFGRPDLAPELPWSLFLERLAEASDSALARIRAIELETEAMQFEMNDLLVHELRSPAEEFAVGVQWIEESVLGDIVDTDRKVEILQALKQSAHQFLELAGSVRTPIQTDDRPAVPLGEALERVGSFYKERLSLRSIQLDWDEDPEWVIGVPFRVVYLVLMSLVRNSRDAIGDRRGNIRILVESAADKVYCHMDDTGCGIPEALRERIFDLGFTTKEDGSGRGLPLARRAMRRHGGDLFLASQAPNEFVTRFTIRFPRSMQ